MIGDRPIYHLKKKEYPQFHFEWHALDKKVYVIDLTKTPKVVTLFATDVGAAELAHLVVQVWLRGFKFGTNLVSTQEQKVA
jgi:hypothetical protein